MNIVFLTKSLNCYKIFEGLIENLIMLHLIISINERFNEKKMSFIGSGWFEDRFFRLIVLINAM